LKEGSKVESRYLDQEAGMDVAVNMSFRAMVVRELEDVPDEVMVEVLDFVRFLKHRLSSLTPEERFERFWMMARRIAAEREITDADIATEIAAVRRGE